MTKTIAIRSDELHKKLEELKREWKMKRYEDVIMNMVLKAEDYRLALQREHPEPTV